MVLKAQLHPRIGRCNVWMMPSRFRQMADSVEKSQRVTMARGRAQDPY